MINNITAFFSSFLLITFTEIGDKTQLLVINFANKYSTKTVLLGILIGSFFSNILAVILGKYITQFTSIEYIIKLIAYITFIFFGFLNIFEKNTTSQENHSNIKNGFISVASAIFLGELGDKTNLSTMAITTQFPNSYMFTLLGATLGMVASNIFSIVLGKYSAKLLSNDWSNVLSTSIFMLFGIIGISSLVDKFFFNSIIYTIIFAIFFTLILILTCKEIYKRKEIIIYE